MCGATRIKHTVGDALVGDSIDDRTAADLKALVRRREHQVDHALLAVQHREGAVGCNDHFGEGLALCVVFDVLAALLLVAADDHAKAAFKPYAQLAQALDGAHHRNRRTLVVDRAAPVDRVADKRCAEGRIRPFFGVCGNNVRVAEDSQHGLFAFLPVHCNNSLVNISDSKSYLLSKILYPFKGTCGALSKGLALLGLRVAE